MSGVGQKAKYSLRANVVRCSPNNGHHATQSLGDSGHGAGAVGLGGQRAFIEAFDGIDLMARRKEAKTILPDLFLPLADAKWPTVDKQDNCLYPWIVKSPDHAGRVEILGLCRRYARLPSEADFQANGRTNA
jgi:hypothetical protein